MNFCTAMLLPGVVPVKLSPGIDGDAYYQDKSALFGGVARITDIDDTGAMIKYYGPEDFTSALKRAWEVRGYLSTQLTGAYVYATQPWNDYGARATATLNHTYSLPFPSPSLPASVPMSNRCAVNPLDTSHGEAPSSLSWKMAEFVGNEYVVPITFTAPLYIGGTATLSQPALRFEISLNVNAGAVQYWKGLWQYPIIAESTITVTEFDQTGSSGPYSTTANDLFAALYYGFTSTYFSGVDPRGVFVDHTVGPLFTDHYEQIPAMFLNIGSITGIPYSWGDGLLTGLVDCQSLFLFDPPVNL